MYTFYDIYSNKVSLSFSEAPFSNNPKHVWVICRHHEEWLLTNHRERGLEFPGGKVEDGETPEEAAIREVMEETGGVVATLHYIGQYKVEGRGKTIIKNIYFASIADLAEQADYYETNGPVLLKELPTRINTEKDYSFIMKDHVLTHSLEKVREQFIASRLS